MKAGISTGGWTVAKRSSGTIPLVEKEILT